MSYIYSNGVAALQDISLRIPLGTLLAVVGRNGAGKTTILNLMSGMIQPTSGHIERNKELKVAHLVQQSKLDHQFPFTVYDVVQMGLWNLKKYIKPYTPFDHERIIEAIACVGLKGYETRTIGSLSGGQFQRMLFARLMLQNADIILLDEPFAAVDEATMVDLMQQMQQWHALGKTLVVVLHDVAFVEKFFPHTLWLAAHGAQFDVTSKILPDKNLCFL